MEPERSDDTPLTALCAGARPLAARLEEFLAVQRRDLPLFARLTERLVERLTAGRAGSGAPEPGAEMPPFLLPDAAGRLVSMTDLVAEGPLVVSFNRGFWCPFCTIEIQALAEVHAAIAARGGSVVSILPDRQGALAPLHAEVGHAVRLLTDMDAAYAASLGLVMWLGDDFVRQARAFGLDLTEAHGSGSGLVPMPATYVLARGGRVVARFVDPDFRLRMEIGTVLEALDAAVAFSKDQAATESRAALDQSRARRSRARAVSGALRSRPATP